ncbi:MAG: helix-hairpin-helix domain-containing protein, partial [Candidimonas sp.]
DLDKPDGLTMIGPGDLQRRIWPLPASKINGIGPKSYLKLVDLGIETIGQLARASPELLQKHFGLTYAQWLLNVAHGLDDRPVAIHSEPKSISRETTFDRDLHVVRDRAELSSVLVHLCERLEDDLKRKGYAGRTIGIKLRFDDFRTVTRDVTLDAPAADAAAILSAARAGLRRVPMTHRLRLLGVRIGALVPCAEDDARSCRGTQLSLY